MRIALIGALGQLGTDLQSRLPGTVTSLDLTELDITDADAVDRVLSEADPEIVINAAAYNWVDQAEDEPEAAFAVNAFGPRNLAMFCDRSDLTFLHVGTDFVYGLDRDRTTPYAEDDAPGPVSAYGSSKLAGEYFAQSLCEKHFVVRTCGLYGHAGRLVQGKGNFVETMLRLANQRDELTVVDDQCCTPTNTVDLADAIVALVQTDKYGLYHATNSGQTTWCEFAKEIFRLSDLDVTVLPLTSHEFGAKAERPSYSVLDCTKLKTAIGVALRPWQAALSDYLATRSVIE